MIVKVIEKNNAAINSVISNQFFLNNIISEKKQNWGRDLWNNFSDFINLIQ